MKRKFWYCFETNIISWLWYLVNCQPASKLFLFLVNAVRVSNKTVVLTKTGLCSIAVGIRNGPHIFLTRPITQCNNVPLFAIAGRVPLWFHIIAKTHKNRIRLYINILLWIRKKNLDVVFLRHACYTIEQNKHKVQLNFPSFDRSQFYCHNNIATFQYLIVPVPVK